jgi:hypothetical protein
VRYLDDAGNQMIVMRLCMTLHSGPAHARRLCSTRIPYPGGGDAAALTRDAAVWRRLGEDGMVTTG